MAGHTTTTTTTTTTSTSTTTSTTIASRLLLRLAILLCLANGGLALKWVRFSVPAWMKRGQDAVLTCQFDLEGERLYSVKWYKAGREFYRYVPGDWPPQQQFPQHGISVDEARSDHQRVQLREVTLEADGRYKCEVLTEAPHFRTLVKSAAMHVVELPRGAPRLEGGQEEYRVGESVNLTCTVPSSVPPATLTWFINGQEVPQDYLSQLPPDVDPLGRNEPRLGLSFRLERWHVEGGRVALRCEGRISRVYQEEVEHSGTVVQPLVPALLEDQPVGMSAGGQMTSGAPPTSLLLMTMMTMTMTMMTVVRA